MTTLVAETAGADLTGLLVARAFGTAAARRQGGLRSRSWGSWGRDARTAV